MAEYEAPAKLNLDLRVGARDASGFHPLHSLVQTIEWLDHLDVDEGDEDSLEVVGAELVEGGENLVWKAVEALGIDRRPPLRVRLHKEIPVSAGLGGGSSDAAAVLAALEDLFRVSRERILEAAARVGSDVPLFLTGGTMLMEGHGEVVTPLPPLEEFAVGVVVADFELPTPQVYERWDQLGGPVGPEIESRLLPPALRSYGELRNDLTPAAVDLIPELGDWMGDLSRIWERPVLMSGSGPSCFAFFLDVEEAEAAVTESPPGRGAKAAALRRRGVSRREK